MTEIIINDLTPRAQYTASAAQTVFTYPFPIFDASDLSVYKTPVGRPPDDVLDKLILNMNYTVQNVGEADGGTITLIAGAANGDIITIERTMPLNRTSDYNDAGSFKAQTVNRDFDREVMMIQQVNTKLENRGLLYQHSDSIPQGMNVLPKLAAGQLWKASHNGTALVAVTFEENPDVSSLRSELESETQLAPGAALVGYYDTSFGAGGTTLNAFLDGLPANLDTHYDARYDARYLKLSDYATTLDTRYLQLANYPTIAYRASLAGSVTIGTAITPIISTAVEFNHGNFYNNTTGIFQPNVAGLYIILADGAASANVLMEIEKNNAPINSAHGQLAFNTTALVYLNGTTDTIRLTARADAGTANFHFGIIMGILIKKI